MKLKLSHGSLLFIIIFSLAVGMYLNKAIEGMTGKTDDTGNKPDKTDKSDKGKKVTKSSVDANQKGVPGNQIPNGDEDMYILKSQIVPPVCPACPANTNCSRDKSPPPCPPCARCPEPAFDCKKVPNYQSSNDQYLPKPMLADFSNF